MKKVEHVGESLLCLLFGAIIVGGILLLPSCRTGMPPIDVSFWAGDSAKGGISRSQEQKTISCQMPEIDQYVCLTYRDLEKIYHTMQLCRDWGGNEMTSHEAKKFITQNRDVYDYVKNSRSRNQDVESVQR